MLQLESIISELKHTGTSLITLNDLRWLYIGPEWDFKRELMIMFERGKLSLITKMKQSLDYRKQREVHIK